MLSAGEELPTDLAVEIKPPVHRESLISIANPLLPVRRPQGALNNRSRAGHLAPFLDWLAWMKSLSHAAIQKMRYGG